MKPSHVSSSPAPGSSARAASQSTAPHRYQLRPACRPSGAPRRRRFLWRARRRRDDGVTARREGGEDRASAGGRPCPVPAGSPSGMTRRARAPPPRACARTKRSSGGGRSRPPRRAPRERAVALGREEVAAATKMFVAKHIGVAPTFGRAAPTAARAARRSRAHASTRSRCPQPGHKHLLVGVCAASRTTRSPPRAARTPVVGGPSTNESSRAARRTRTPRRRVHHSGPQKRHMWRYPIPYPRIGGIRSAYAADAGRPKTGRRAQRSRRRRPRRGSLPCDVEKVVEDETGTAPPCQRRSSDIERTRSRASRSSAQHT